MNYSKIYNDLINKAKNRLIIGYYEKHHIIPKCIGGSDEEKNIVNLTPEEHYIAHQLLVKINPGNYSLAYAATMMTVKRTNNKVHGWLARHRNILAKGKKGPSTSCYKTTWITDGTVDKRLKVGSILPDGWRLGRVYKHSMSTRQIIGEATSQRVISEETKKKISEGNKGKKMPEEAKRKISLYQQNKKFLKRGCSVIG